MTMFLAVKSEQEQRWSGGTTGISAAKSVFGADSAYDNSLFSEYMRQLISDRRTVYLDDRSKLASSDLYPVKKHDPASSVAPQWFSGLRSVLDKSIRPLSSRVQELRAIKSPAELQVMQKVADISCNGFRTVMRSRASYESEHHLAAAYEYDIKRQGASGYGYIPVVAGGANACTLHYVYNDMPLRKGELLLMDAGARYGGYVSDITRTWPVDGQLSPAQRDLYEVVLTVQRECIKHCTESSGKSLDQIHEISVDILFRELQRLGFTGSRYEVCQQLYFHHVGHYLGMDVHDTPAISRSRKLRAGMVVTIEPGVYVPPLSSMPQKYHHIGIRIEDDVVVGETVPTVLTASAPKETADVEQ
ncbi:aminopeptidase [Sorochytrium milnesiophthora]